MQQSALYGYCWISGVQFLTQWYNPWFCDVTFDCLARAVAVSNDCDIHRSNICHQRHLSHGKTRRPYMSEQRRHSVGSMWLRCITGFGPVCLALSIYRSKSISANVIIIIITVMITLQWSVLYFKMQNGVEKWSMNKSSVRDCSIDLHGTLMHIRTHRHIESFMLDLPMGLSSCIHYMVDWSENWHLIEFLQRDFLNAFFGLMRNYHYLPLQALLILLDIFLEEDRGSNPISSGGGVQWIVLIYDQYSHCSRSDWLHTLACTRQQIGEPWVRMQCYLFLISPSGTFCKKHGKIACRLYQSGYQSERFFLYCSKYEIYSSIEVIWITSVCCVEKCSDIQWHHSAFWYHTKFGHSEPSLSKFWHPILHHLI